MNKLINVIQIIAYTSIQSLFVRKNHSKKKNNLILFEYIGIGDLLCALDSIDQLFEYYMQKNEYLWIGVSKSLENVIQRLRPQWSSFVIIVDFNHNHRFLFKSFKGNVEVLSINAWHDIIVYSSWGKYYFLLCNAIGYKRIIYPIWGGDTKINKEHIIIGIPRTAMRFTMYSLIISAVMGADAKCGIAHIEPIATNCIDEEYCIVSMCVEDSHAYPYRAWPIDHFITVIKWILDNTSWNVVLTGIKPHEEIIKSIVHKLGYDNRVINLMGKTTFEDWLSVIQDAICIISNDTGDVHVAAALDTKSFVIAGYWDYGRFLPYDAEFIKSNIIPTPIYGPEPSCKWCRLDGLCLNNEESVAFRRCCDAMIKEHSIYACLNEVTPDMVIKEIKLWMH
ncbi:glycosyltransferase family 9 protein [Veillonella sp.]|uniref:glycosyltransferase family 9 protein n=1 Tax=Veillonella sp. TaxID=1926307 RepID=UPI002904ED03|nr:glycosyltransferase family 9 protein [Veillonella sp.]MDU1672589.1 glycosyltransferase family 9 protein [Veillonella sp.]MDU1680305.1 glycosyltransferase family 9 protein [Veillonella sp.]MDU1742768.1 glycosyltransferase family 9 protein [Veillonella sp.]